VYEQEQDTHQRVAPAVTTLPSREDDPVPVASRSEDGGAAAEALRQQGRLADLAADVRDRAAEARHFRAALRDQGSDPDVTKARDFWANRCPNGTLRESGTTEAARRET
jgi:hypothetical protein